MAVSTFNPKNCQVVFGGKLIGGWAPDTFVSIDHNADMYNLVIGADSVGARVKTNNFSGRITLTLQQTSPSNDDLNAIATADEQGDSGALPFYFKSGNFVATAVTAWIVKRPTAEFSQSISSRVWVLETEYLTVESAAG